MSRKRKPTPGVELRVQRIRAGARQEDLALAVGVCRQRISQIERSASVGPDWAERYLEGLRIATAA